jgi:hypothetical protein
MVGFLSRLPPLGVRPRRRHVATMPNRQWPRLEAISWGPDRRVATMRRDVEAKCDERPGARGGATPRSWGGRKRGVLVSSWLICPCGAGKLNRSIAGVVSMRREFSRRPCRCSRGSGDCSTSRGRPATQCGLAAPPQGRVAATNSARGAARSRFFSCRSPAALGGSGGSIRWATCGEGRPWCR